MYMLKDAPLADFDELPVPFRKVPVELPHLSPNQIVPEEDQNRLLAIDDAFTRGFFEIGDIACRLIEYSPQLSRDGFSIVTHEDVYESVSKFCRREPRTVRYYAETAAFFSPEVRDEFDALPFSHFVVARSFEQKWRDVLEFAAANPMMSASSLRMHFVGREAIGDSSLPGTGEDPSVDNQQLSSPPQALPLHVSAAVLSAVSGLIDGLRKLVNGATLREDTRDRVCAILDDIMNVLPEIKRDIESAAEEN